MEKSLKCILKFKILLLISCVLSVGHSYAQNEVRTDSLEASLLTCTPGTDAYAHFGHTAIRITNYDLRKDIVFNFGCFDSNMDDFVMKFMLGETDYVLDGEPADFFVWKYNEMGMGVTEQVLNLTTKEKAKLFALLLENLKPENQKYRYNWLYDNCTTRARDVIEKAIDGEVAYYKKVEDKTARNLLHDCLGNASWLKFGIDMLLGTEIDSKANRRIQMFIPNIYLQEIDNAIITDAKGVERQLLASKSTILKDKNLDKKDTPFTPMVAFTALLILAIAVSIFDIKRGKVSDILDILMTAGQGISGCIVAFLFFLSEHPAVDSNWLVIMFNPLFLFYAIWIAICSFTKRTDKVAYVNMAVSVLFFMTMFICPQQFNSAMYPLVLSLMVRSCTRAKAAFKKTK